MQNTSRRDFLKASSLAAAGTALLSVNEGAHAAASDTLKIALIGCGGRGTGAAYDNLNGCEGTQIIAVADAFEDNAKNTADRLRKDKADRVDLPEDRVFWGFDAYEKAIACDCDMVIMATPPGFRPIHYAAAIKAGKHVFMEKPCCVDAPGYRSLQETNKLADAKGLKVGVGLQRHHQGGYINGISEIKDGKWGDILYQRVYWNGGGVWTRPRRAGMTEMEYQMRNWYYFVWLCGDHIVEQHVHNLDIANWIKDDHPVEANGLGGRQVRTGKEHGEIYDHFFCEFTYKDGTKTFSQCRHQGNAWSIVDEYAHGTKGGGRVSSGNVDLKHDNPYVQEHYDLVNAIRANEKFNEGYIGATSTFTAVLGRMATYSGQVIKWDDAVAKGPNLMPEKFDFAAEPPVLPNADGFYPIAMPGQTPAF